MEQFFTKLYNDNSNGHLNRWTIGGWVFRNHNYCRRINIVENKEALRK